MFYCFFSYISYNQKYLIDYGQCNELYYVIRTIFHDILCYLKCFESSCITPLLPDPSPAEDDELELALLTVMPLMLGVLLEVEFDVATRLLYELSEI